MAVASGRLACAVLAVLAVGVAAADLPPGVRLAVRLTSDVSTKTSRPGDRVSAVLLAAVPLDGVVIPAGTRVRGVVRQATPFTWRNPQAVLRVDFDGLVDVRGQVTPMDARVVEVDNARETVDSEGRVLGIVPPQSRPALVEELLLLAAFLPEAFAVDTAEYRLRAQERPDVVFAAGVEMTIETRSLTANVPTVSALATSVMDDDLRHLAVGQPLRTTAGASRTPADITNVLLVGSRQQVENAFRAAGWTSADALGLRADVKTLLAVAEDRGYLEGPVSQQWLQGALPDLVFQKQNNTFAKRHHVRLWRRPQTWQGRDAWLGAATHDVGIKFVSQERSFTHAIETSIDLERQKIVDDLAFAGATARAALADRPSVPARSENATHDPVQTDGRIAVMILR